MSLFLLTLWHFVCTQGAAAQSILNTAQAQWRFEGEVASEQSNTVEVTLAAARPTLRFFARNDDGQSFDYHGVGCAGSEPDGSESDAPGALISAALSPIDAGSAGADVFVVIDALQANRSAQAIDVLTLQIVGGSGDRETLTVFETGENTGRFVAGIATRQGRLATQNNCVLEVAGDENVTVQVLPAPEAQPFLSETFAIEARPLGLVFDAGSGAPVSGAQITVIDTLTDDRAQVFDTDGVTPWPSTIVSGEPIRLEDGAIIQLAAGEYWFPHLPAGTYRLLIEPPDPFAAPSTATPAQIAALSRPDEGAFRISDGAFGEAFTLAQAGAPGFDIPLDRSSLDLQITKTISRQVAQPGDAVVFTVTVTNPDPFVTKRDVVLVEESSTALRLRKGKITLDGEPITDGLTLAGNGAGLVLALGDLAPGASHRLVYAMTVRSDASPGNEESRSDLSSGTDIEARASTTLRVLRESVADRMTIIGRVTAGPCALERGREGVAGVRIMMEDGSFAITDAQGRYHFDGVVPGTHVVQAARATLPEGAELVNCNLGVRNAGSALSQFASGRGGSLVVADFYVVMPEATDVVALSPDEPVENAQSDTADPSAPVAPTNWLALGDGPDGWLSPAVDANPRAPAVSVAIRHRPGHTVTLMVDGDEVNPLLFEGVQTSATQTWAVSLWRAVPLPDERTELRADIRSADGALVTTLDREVFFTTTPARAELVEEQSVLIADGKTRPVIAVRMLDAAGRPLREGLSGTLNLSAPYLSAEQIDQRQLVSTSRRGPAPARWRVDGADGIAMIELAPTMVSGSITLDFAFANGDIIRDQQLEAWIVPGDVEWTVIGLAETSVGARSIADNMERTGAFDSDLGENARVALYAKGRILGRFLTTIAYDSAKQRDEQRVLGTLDPDTYYTVFADGSTRLFDAASREKLYLRIETANFFAVYGDFVTGFDQTRLARYNRTMTGVQAQARLGQIEVEAFAAKTSSLLRRDEFQGAGISGPYTLSSTAIVPNSESVFIEVRDRFRPEVIVERRALEPFIDYEIDLLSGSLQFAQPILSRTVNDDPQFIIAEYEVDRISDGELNAGVRASWQSDDGNLRVGGSAFSDAGEDGRTDVVGVDLTAQVGISTQIRAEAAASRQGGEKAAGWSVEVDHQSETVDLRAYAQQLDRNFGVGQQNGVELGTRRVGADGQVALSDTAFLAASAWQADSLEDARQRRAAQISLGKRDQHRDFSIGLSRFDDRSAEGERGSSTTLDLAAAQRFLGNRLEVSGSASLALDQAESVDLPARYRLGARYALSEAVRLNGSYEIAESDTISARTLRGGAEVTAWPGGQIAADVGQQSQTGAATGTFAGLRLAQSLALGADLTLSVTLDQNWGQVAKDPQSLVLSPGQPFASGGQLGAGGGLLEDFTAITLGAAWNKDLWTVNARGEYRDGERANRRGLIMGAVRQLGNGSMLGAGTTWTRASGANATSTEIFDAALAFAHRPQDRSIALLGKLEYRSDAVEAAVSGETGPLGRTALTVDGNAISRRGIASVSADLTGILDFVGLNASTRRRSDLGLFAAIRHNFDQVEGLDLTTTSLVASITPRISLSPKLDLGLSATTRSALGGGEFSYSVGPFASLQIASNTVVTLGYNIAGFSDADFEVARQTRDGLFLNLTAKIDDEALSAVGSRLRNGIF